MDKLAVTFCYLWPTEKLWLRGGGGAGGVFRLLWERVFKLCMHLESGRVYCWKETQDAEINFCLLFAFFLFSISLSNVIHREICVKDFSGTTAPRILKFGTKCWVWLVVMCKRESASCSYHFLYLFIFLSCQSNFLLLISRLL